MENFKIIELKSKVCEGVCVSHAPTGENDTPSVFIEAWVGDENTEPYHISESIDFSSRGQARDYVRTFDIISAQNFLDRNYTE